MSKLQRTPLPGDRACTSCLSIFTPKRSQGAAIVYLCTGSIFMLLTLIGVTAGGSPVFLVFLFIAVASLGVGMRRLKPSPACTVCGNAATVPAETPAGQKIIRQAQ